MADDKKKPAEAPKAAAAPAEAPKAAAAAAPKAKPKAAAPKAAKQKKSEKWKKYDLSGDKVKRTNKHCPKCGEGTFLAHHATRDACGKCGYTEFRKTDDKKK
jgi:small subunit ribosomal protein S27Ae